MASQNRSPYPEAPPPYSANMQQYPARMPVPYPMSNNGFPQPTGAQHVQQYQQQQQYQQYLQQQQQQQVQPYQQPPQQPMAYGYEYPPYGGDPYHRRFGPRRLGGFLFRSMFRPRFYGRRHCCHW
ncbi:unnamed protein product [Caenorhabditis auriculariae]|uniref:Uncharacterized protein n=1 Tax=Caenorhabditis auriculariae TaxID=2777116 RepID=A0A8S1GQ11_9PELO|nr:unnamed protein product [Caenorhabditis auriculariae]